MYLLALNIAIVAYVYSVILTEPGMILSGWYKYLLSLNLPEWIFKPIIDCFKCVAGQMALWGYFINCNAYNPFDHIFFICLTILISILIDKLLTWNSNK